MIPKGPANSNSTSGKAKKENCSRSSYLVYLPHQYAKCSCQKISITKQHSLDLYLYSTETCDNNNLPVTAIYIRIQLKQSHGDLGVRSAYESSENAEISSFEKCVDRTHTADVWCHRGSFKIDVRRQFFKRIFWPRHLPWKARFCTRLRGNGLSTPAPVRHTPLTHCKKSAWTLILSDP